MIGTALAHYRITAALGAGGMGEVWRAQDEKLGREVALKVLPAEFAADPQRLDRFEREARAVAALNHPHIVTIYSVEEVGGTRFLTMELIDGKSLDHLIPDGGLDLGRFFELATPLAEAISAAHDKSVIHRHGSADRRRNHRRHGALHVARAGRGAAGRPPDGHFLARGAAL
ncbi:MAG: serine/threonine-protein kinase [Acidobacteriota bacterium]